jgi:hypothetical protein
MSVLFEIILAAVLIGALVVLWRVGAHACRTPVPRPSDAEIFTVVLASGSGDGLEQTTASLLWLSGATGNTDRIIIADTGLTREGAHVAELIARDSHRVAVCPVQNIPEYILSQKNLIT